MDVKQSSKRNLFGNPDRELVARDKTLLVKNIRPFALKCMTFSTVLGRIR